MGIEAWYLDSSDEDQRKPHRMNPNQPVALEELKKLGVFYWKVTGTLTRLTASLAAFYVTVYQADGLKVSVRFFGSAMGTDSVIDAYLL